MIIQLVLPTNTILGFWENWLVKSDCSLTHSSESDCWILIQRIFLCNYFLDRLWISIDYNLINNDGSCMHKSFYQ